MGVGWCGGAHTDSARPAVPALTSTAAHLISTHPPQPISSRYYAAHVRSHFFVNLGVAGGLLLSQTFGGGRFAVDRLVRKKSH